MGRLIRISLEEFLKRQPKKDTFKATAYLKNGKKVELQGPSFILLNSELCSIATKIKKIVYNKNNPSWESRKTSKRKVRNASLRRR